MMMELFASLQRFLNSHFYLLVLIGAVIFSLRTPKRRHFLLRLVLSLVVCIGLCEILEMTIYTAMMSVTDNLVVLSFFEMVRALFLYAVSVAVILCCYQYRLKNACYVCVFGYTLQHMTLLVYYLVCYYFVPGGNSAARILLFYLVYSSVYVAEYLLLRNREDAVNIENTTMIIQSVIFLFCSVILSVLSYNYIVSNEALVGTPAVFVVSMFGVVMCVNIIIGLLDSFQTRKVQDELAMTRKLWQENVRQYELTKQTVDILNFRYHDLRNQMNLLVQDRDVAQEIENCLDSYYDSIRTGNEAMDVVLTEKSVLCRKNEIVFTCIADGQCLSYMSPVDIYSVLGNIIDNAVEYLSAIADKEKRVISLMIRREGDMDMIQIENFLAERPREEQGMPLTTKKDKENHGYGLKSVRHILKKYEGIMRISMENRMFSLTIALPQKK